MDEPAIEKLGAAPLAPTLGTDCGAPQSTANWASTSAGSIWRSGAAACYSAFGSNQDYANSNQVIAFATAGGLGLPDRDYYTKTDRSVAVELRDCTPSTWQRMFVLLGDTPAAAQAPSGDGAHGLETALARRLAHSGGEA